MRNKIMIGTAAVAASFIMAAGGALAQSPSMSPTPSPSPSASAMTTVPSAAPATGFGGN